MESKSNCELFSTLEKEDHINVLELRAVLFGLRSLKKDLKSIHIKALCHKSTAVACINKFGTSRSFECDSLAQILALAAQAHISYMGLGN